VALANGIPVLRRVNCSWRSGGANTVENWTIKHILDLAKEGTDKLLRDISDADLARTHQGVLSVAQRSGVLALHAQLPKLDP